LCEQKLEKVNKQCFKGKSWKTV